jgi:hypothetical protein
MSGLPTPVTLIETVVVSCVCFAVAGVLEELTHAAAARPWAVRQELRLTGVTSEIDADCSRKVDIWISLAPFFVGLTVLAALSLSIQIRPLSETTMLGIAAWGYYSLPSLTDLKGAAGVSQTEREPLSRPARRGVQLFCVGWLCLLGADEVGVLLFGLPAPTPVPDFIGSSINAFTVATALTWFGLVTLTGAVVILIQTGKKRN